jgi:hypothetical protein
MWPLANPTPDDTLLSGSPTGLPRRPSRPRSTAWPNGVAFGVANNTVMTVMDLLLAIDSQAVNGVLYNGNTAKRTKANNVFGAINQAGHI